MCEAPLVLNTLMVSFPSPLLSPVIKAFTNGPVPSEG